MDGTEAILKKYVRAAKNRNDAFANWASFGDDPDSPESEVLRERYVAAVNQCNSWSHAYYLALNRN